MSKVKIDKMLHSGFVKSHLLPQRWDFTSIPGILLNFPSVSCMLSPVHSPERIFHVLFKRELVNDNFRAADEEKREKSERCPFFRLQNERKRWSELSVQRTKTDIIPSEIWLKYNLGWHHVCKRKKQTTDQVNT